MQVYTPPYLYGSDGALAPRPTIDISTDDANNGDEMTVTSSEPLTIIAIIRFGTATHALNTDQRRIELCGPLAGKACGGGKAYDVQIPDDPGHAVGGRWMVFGVNAKGVPSVSKTLFITP